MEPNPLNSNPQNPRKGIVILFLNYRFNVM